ncbi:MAG: KpsF/GutQ family sugar-phosphate isomerase [bacterium]|jgi:arabinose-5-phosphate isomerase
MKKTTQEDATILAQGKMVLTAEADALQDLAANLTGDFAAAVRLLSECRGKVAVTGIGKSGHIGKKIAASLASTGTPSFFLHAAESLHGDLGMLTSDDVVIAVSHSGETPEMLRMLPYLADTGIPLISLTGKTGSSLGRACRVNLVTGVREEADPLGLAPTCSTTAALALGDALVVAVSVRKGFTREEFAFRHPGGTLGQLLFRISTEDRR